MKKRYYSWEECISLREVKVIWPTTSVLTHFNLFHKSYRMFLCSHCVEWIIQILWSSKKSSENMISCTLCLNIWWAMSQNLLLSSIMLLLIGLTGVSKLAIVFYDLVIDDCHLLMISIYCRNLICTSLWKIRKSFSLNLKSEIGVFKFFKALLTCISVDIFIVTSSQVIFSFYKNLGKYLFWEDLICLQILFVLESYC